MWTDIALVRSCRHLWSWWRSGLWCTLLTWRRNWSNRVVCMKAKGSVGTTGVVRNTLWINMTQLCILDLQLVLLSIALLNYVENLIWFIFKQFGQDYFSHCTHTIYIFSNVYFISAYGNGMCIRACVSPGIVIKLQPFLIFENVTKSRISWVNLESKRNLFCLYPKWCSVVGCFIFFKEEFLFLLLFECLWLALFLPQLFECNVEASGRDCNSCSVCVCLSEALYIPQELDSSAVLRDLISVCLFGSVSISMNHHSDCWWSEPKTAIKHKDSVVIRLATTFGCWLFIRPHLSNIVIKKNVIELCYNSW